MSRRKTFLTSLTALLDDLTNISQDESLSNTIGQKKFLAALEAFTPIAERIISAGTDFSADPVLAKEFADTLTMVRWHLDGAGILKNDTVLDQYPGLKDLWLTQTDGFYLLHGGTGIPVEALHRATGLEVVERGYLNNLTLRFPDIDVQSQIEDMLGESFLFVERDTMQSVYQQIADIINDALEQPRDKPLIEKDSFPVIPFLNAMDISTHINPMS